MNQNNKLKMFVTNAIKKKSTGPIWCDYLESDGTQIIQVTEPLDIRKNICVKIRVKWLTPFANRRQAMGISNGAAGKYFEIRPNPDGKIVYAQGNTYSEAEPSLDDFDEILFDAQTWEGILYVNGKEAIRRDTTVGGSAMFNLFGMAQYPQFNSICQISSAQIYYPESKKLIRNLRPCLHPDTMDPCMYDTVEGKYYFKPSGHDFKYQISFDALDHITTDGHQYIDTGYILGGDSAVDVTISNVKYNDNKGNFNVLFSGSQVTKPRFDMYFSEPGWTISDKNRVTIQAQYETKLSNMVIWNFVYNSPKKSRIQQIQNKVFVDDKDCGNITSEPLKFICDYTLTLFKDKRYSYIGLGANLHNCIIKENTILVRDMIPVKRKDGVLCMYDFITGTYFENAGTGSFTS